jgi:outer membrane biosynthesis protein TonB
MSAEHGAPQLRSAVGASVAAHVLAIGLAFAAGKLPARDAPAFDQIPVRLDLTPLRGPMMEAAPPKPAPPAAAEKPPPPSVPAAPPPTPKAPPPIPKATPPATAEKPRIAAPRMATPPARSPARAPPSRVAARKPATPPPEEFDAEDSGAEVDSAIERVLRQLETDATAPAGPPPASPASLVALGGGRAASAAGAMTGPGGTGPGPSTEDLVRDYASAIRVAVESAYAIPAGIPRDAARDAIVHLRVDSTGHVLEFAIASSSGFAVLDDLLRGVFARIALPAPPAAVAARAHRGGLRIVFPFASSQGASS